jgi:hypothetical protein
MAAGANAAAQAIRVARMVNFMVVVVVVVVVVGKQVLECEGSDPKNRFRLKVSC